MSGAEEKVERAITLDEIEVLAKGHLIDIPSWEPGKTIKVRVRKIDISPLILEAGIIPDQLSLEVSTLFEDGDSKKKTPSGGGEKVDFKMDKLMPVLDAMSKAALIEPTFDEINSKYPLTIDQKMAIFAFLSGGIEKIKPFRAK
jgi:hypothetical protein